ncbi:zinc finger protein 675-like [Physella acuta]|uniref:zinc finger protein 675-like n=1 Tax=Physella acuta TaxID=109671 RepID=UPI0027DAF120|nr:zinc finger protein 675-like [Physella acuta]
MRAKLKKLTRSQLEFLLCVLRSKILKFEPHFSLLKMFQLFKLWHSDSEYLGEHQSKKGHSRGMVGKNKCQQITELNILQRSRIQAQVKNQQTVDTVQNSENMAASLKSARRLSIASLKKNEIIMKEHDHKDCHGMQCLDVSGSHARLERCDASADQLTSHRNSCEENIPSEVAQNIADLNFGLEKHNNINACNNEVQKCSERMIRLRKKLQVKEASSGVKDSSRFLHCEKLCNKVSPSQPAKISKLNHHNNQQLNNNVLSIKEEETCLNLQPKTLTCLICGLGFLNQHTLKTHIKKIHDKMRVLCSYCGKLLLSSRVKAHLDKVHEKPSYTCHICQRGFLKRECLEGHMNKHSKTKPYICQHCGRKYAYSTSLSAHKKICSKSAVPPHLVHAHSLDAKDTSFICEICGLTFEGTSGLKDHFSAKHSNKIQKCIHCGQAFHWRPSYNRHVKKCKDKTDSERKKPPALSDKIYFCKCGKSFQYRQSLSRHKKSCQSEVTSFPASLGDIWS